MGSGPSKEKDSPVQTSRTSTSVVKTSEPAPTNQKSENVTNSNGRKVEPLKHSEFGHRQQNGNTNKENNNKSKGRIPQPFDDSDDEGDDLLNDDWKNKNSKNKNNKSNNNSNNKIKTWEPPLPPTEQYPETYAQKMQREQYKHEQLLRQKTIYRNPEEWEMADQSNENQNTTDTNVSQQSFDVSKFKDANRTLPKTDIFGPLSTNDYLYRNPEADNYYQTSNYNRKKSVPKYDVTEEELMNDIESHYY